MKKLLLVISVMFAIVSNSHANSVNIINTTNCSFDVEVYAGPSGGSCAANMSNPYFIAASSGNNYLPYSAFSWIGPQPIISAVVNIFKVFNYPDCNTGVVVGTVACGSTISTTFSTCTCATTNPIYVDYYLVGTVYTCEIHY